MSAATILKFLIILLLDLCFVHEFPGVWIAGELDSQLMQSLISNYLPFPSQGSQPPAHCPTQGLMPLSTWRRLGAGRERAVIGHVGLGC